MKQKLLLILLFALFAYTGGFAQSKLVTGKITSSEDGSALPGVSVIIKGTTQGTVSDVDGNFSISVSGTNPVLVFKYLGFKDQEVNVATTSTIDISMVVEDKTLDEIVVIAFGEGDKDKLTGAVGEVTAAQIEKRPLTNVANALSGTISGVLTNAATGQPGNAPAIRVRGFGSVNASSDPLYVVDGIPYDQGISNINPQDIASISVLKDASTAALYGSRAANGVVMITTKRGNAKQTRFNFQALYGITQRALPEYDRVGPQDYYTLMWEAFRNAQVTGGADIAVAGQSASNNITSALGGYNPFNVPNDQLISTTGVFNPNAQLLYSDFDWFDPIERNGTRSDYNFSFSGGSGNTDYYVSLGYLTEKGYLINSDFDRWTARINVNTELRKWLKAGVNVAATYTESQQARTGSASIVNPFNSARGIGAIYPVYLRDQAGQLVLDAAGNPQFDLGFGDADLGLLGRPGSTGRHVVAETLLNQDQYKRTVLSGRTFVEANFLKNFTFRFNAGVDLFSFYELGYDNPLVGDGAPAGRANRLSSTEATINLNQLLSYKNTFAEKHTLEVLVGHESYSFVDNGFSGSRQGQIVEGNNELINFTDINSVTSSTSDRSIEGYFSRLNYDYNNKYFLSASLRTDGSSRFAPDVRWGTFASVGAAWRLDNEAFMANVAWVDVLKLRSSYGQLGNESVGGFYPWQALYGLGFNNVDEPGFLQTVLPDPTLQWETNSTFDVGVDFTLQKGRVRGSVEYYNRGSSNLIFDVPQPLSAGTPAGVITQNVGTMVNSGFEIQVAVDVIRTNDFTWNIDLNASTIRNRITKLPQEEIITGTKKLQVGRSIFDYWLRQYYGVNSENGDALWVADTQSAGFDIDDAVIINTDTLTTEFNQAEFAYVGTAIPDLFGGITNTFRYKNFSLSILTTYQIGGLTYDGVYAGLMNAGEYGRALHVDALNRWQTTGNNTDVPRMDNSRASIFNAGSDRWLTSSTHLNLRQVTLSYEFSPSLLSKAKIANASVYVTGENLILFSARKGMNVQQGFTGVTSNAFIPARVLSFGLNVGF